MKINIWFKRIIVSILSVSLFVFGTFKQKEEVKVEAAAITLTTVAVVGLLLVASGLTLKKNISNDSLGKIYSDLSTDVKEGIDDLVENAVVTATGTFIVGKLLMQKFLWDIYSKFNIHKISDQDNYVLYNGYVPKKGYVLGNYANSNNMWDTFYWKDVNFAVPGHYGPLTYQIEMYFRPGKNSGEIRQSLRTIEFQTTKWGAGSSIFFKNSCISGICGGGEIYQTIDFINEIDLGIGYLNSDSYENALYSLFTYYGDVEVDSSLGYNNFDFVRVNENTIGRRLKYNNSVVTNEQTFYESLYNNEIVVSTAPGWTLPFPGPGRSWDTYDNDNVDFNENDWTFDESGNLVIAGAAAAAAGSWGTLNPGWVRNPAQDIPGEDDDELTGPIALPNTDVGGLDLPDLDGLDMDADVPSGLLAGLLGILAAGLGHLLQGLLNGIKALFGWLGQVLSQLWALIKALIDALGISIVNAIELVKTAILSLADTLWSWLTNIYEAVLDMWHWMLDISKLLAFIVKLFAFLFNMLIALIDLIVVKVFGEMIPKINAFVTSIKQIFSALPNPLNVMAYRMIDISAFLSVLLVIIKLINLRRV